ncbi:hypothetical protein JZ751_025879, partial [Albula glossodonta]
MSVSLSQHRQTDVSHTEEMFSFPGGEGSGDPGCGSGLTLYPISILTWDRTVGFSSLVMDSLCPLESSQVTLNVWGTPSMSVGLSQDRQTDVSHREEMFSFPGGEGSG